jgi:glycine/D-amino acid oxidase-like deaminating enzyme/nitrite reductase/ring-hydroxylating ferredoxin subunit
MSAVIQSRTTGVRLERTRTTLAHIPGMIERNTPSRPSLWQATVDQPGLSSMPLPDSTDVLVVGGGITGLTTALRLQQGGRKVTLIEAKVIGAGESGLTTAHLTEALDARYYSIRDTIGADAARLAAEMSREAIEQIASFVERHSIDCAFERLPGFLYTDDADDAAEIDKELEASREAGLDCSFTREVPLPFETAGAIRYENQAQFHAGAYLLGLAAAFRQAGGAVVEATRFLSIEEGTPCRVETSRGVIAANDVVLATNVPINNRLFLITKAHSYRTYALAVEAPEVKVGKGLFWDTAEPYHYIRLQQWSGRDWLIIGGCDHKTGENEDTEESYAALEHYSRRRFGIGQPSFRWSGQVVEPLDGLPYIGRNSGSDHLWLATGYSGQGMTMGTTAGIVLSDLLLGKENRFAKLLSPRRIELSTAGEYIAENIDFPKELVLQHLLRSDVEKIALAGIAPGDGKIVQLDGRKVAAARDSDGKLHTLSPTCPHMGCDVRWNRAESSWDCPCHGSRFSCDGTMLNGPAATDLRPIEVEPDKE